MSTISDMVFGVGHKLDANGHPIERGIGNLHDRTKYSVAAEAAPAPPVPAVATAASVQEPGAVSALPVAVPASDVHPAEAVVPAEAPTSAPVPAGTLAPATPVIPAAHPGLIAHLKALLAEAEKTISDL